MSPRTDLLDLYRLVALDSHLEPGWTKLGPNAEGQGPETDNPAPTGPKVPDAPEPTSADPTDPAASTDPTASAVPTDRAGGPNNLPSSLPDAAAVDAARSQAGNAPPDVDGVLDIEKLELLVSASQRAQRDGTSLAERGKSLPQLHDLVRSMRHDGASLDETETNNLLDVIDQTAAVTEPQIVWHDFRRGQRVRPRPDNDRNYHKRISALAKRVAIRDAHVPPVTSRGSIIRVKPRPANPGRFERQPIEYAVYLETEARYDTTIEEWSSMGVEVMATSLLAPSKWPQCHDFWCAMIDVTASDDGLPDEVDLTRARVDQPLSGIDDWLYWEQVGDRTARPERASRRRQSRDLFPLTFLRCRRRVAGDNAYLTYELVRDIGPAEVDQPLTVDDGSIAVAKRGTEVAITTTKTIHFKPSLGQTEGQSIAEFASASGWASGSRRMTEACRRLALADAG